MCDVNGPFKLCSCSEKIDKKKPYWVLRTNKIDGDEHYVLGMFSQPNILFTPIVRRNILRRLNYIKSVFDFDYTPQENDLLKLCGEYDEYYLVYESGKWRWLENFQYEGKRSGKFKSKKRGYIEGKQSNLMKVLNDYETLTKTSLYECDDFGFSIPKNEFEKELYTTKLNQSEIIEMIQKEIKRLKNKQK